jgi:hypothetical protein
MKLDVDIPNYAFVLHLGPPGSQKAYFNIEKPRNGGKPLLNLPFEGREKHGYRLHHGICGDLTEYFRKKRIDIGQEDIL